MTRTLRDILLVCLGSVVTLVVQSGAPAVGVMLYERDFKAAYTDCEMAKAEAGRVKPSAVSAGTYARLRKTFMVGEFRCLDSQALYDRLREFRVGDATVNHMEIDAKEEAADVTQ